MSTTNTLTRTGTSRLAPSSTLRQYRAFEDLQEPCFLTISPDCITVTYQMKSIICTHQWRDVLHAKTHHLSSHIPSSTPTTNPKKTPNSNILKIRFCSTAPEKVKQYRFDSRPILDEFLADAMRNHALERVVQRKVLLGTTVKYVPVGEQNGENAIHDHTKNEYQTQNQNQNQQNGDKNNKSFKNGSLKKRNKNHD